MKPIRINPFRRYNEDWAIVTAGEEGCFNGMTISWGSMGTIWNRPILTVYVRPDRYTWQFLEKHDVFTVSFFPEQYRAALTVMGRKSGRDCDKPKEAGLTPISVAGSVSYREAEQTFVCKKLYMNQLNYDAVPDFAKQIYRDGVQPHYLIMGEVVDILDAEN